MARIPDHEIERLKKEISVERLAEARGIQLTRHGADLVGKCPFHDDRTPSLVITPAKNLWHCLEIYAPDGTGTLRESLQKYQSRLEDLKKSISEFAANSALKKSL
jgi:hypothetical protein